MNVKRGFRRIIFILSTIVAALTAFFCFFTVFNTLVAQQNAYNYSSEEYKNITEFWRVWDQDGWSSGKYQVIRSLLDETSEYVGTSFYLNGKQIKTSPQDIFPGVNRAMVYISISELNKEAQVAKQKAIENITNKVKSYEYWGTKSRNELILVSVAAALAGVVLGYAGAWVIFWFGGLAVCRFFAWMAHGFNEGASLGILKGEGHDKQMIRDIIKWAIIIVIAAVIFAVTYRITT
jgi:hypothetical protein